MLGRQQQDPFELYDLHRQMGTGNMEPTDEHGVPRAWYEDPYRILDSLGVGYKDAPTPVTYDTLRLMAERNSIVSIVHSMITKTAESFCRRPRHKYDIGFRVVHKYKRPEETTDAERKRATELEDFFLNTGAHKDYKRDNLRKITHKLVTDRLTYDQMNMELCHAYNGKLTSFHHVPAYTMRLSPPKNRKGTPPTLWEQENEAQYVQIIDNQVVQAWTEPKFVWDTANPRSTLFGHHYGFSELEKLIITVTSHLWAEEWNRNMFSQGSSMKGIINLRGNVPPEKLQDMRRQWLLQAAGVWNAHRQMFTNTDGLDWIPLNLSNVEMGFGDWIRYLIQIICLAYGVSPDAVGFDLRTGATGTAISFNSNEAAVQGSKDRFLRPLFQQIEDVFNGPKMMGCLDDNYAFQFYGLSIQDEEKYLQNRIQELQHFKTMNEVRKQENLPPVENGDIPMNPVYTGYVMQKEMAAGAAGGGGEEGGDPMAAMMQQAPKPPPQGPNQKGQPQGVNAGDADFFQQMIQGMQDKQQQGLQKALQTSYYPQVADIFTHYDPNDVDIF